MSDRPGEGYLVKSAPSSGARHVRFCPDSRHCSAPLACPLSAKSCHMRCSKPLSVMAPNWRRRGAVFSESQIDDFVMAITSAEAIGLASSPPFLVTGLVEGGLSSWERRVSTLRDDPMG